mgnify:CR=1 FL=1
MVNKLLEMILEKTYYVVQAEFSDDTYKKYFHIYLSNKYEKNLEEFILEESEDIVQAIIDSYIEDELKFWKNLNRSEMLSILDKDAAFEQLMFLSDIAFKNAQECVRTGVYLSDTEEYKLRLEELAQCLDAIKPHNIEYAKELLSESILDIDFVFNKSNIKSLRLARII